MQHPILSSTKPIAYYGGIWAIVILTHIALILITTPVSALVAVADALVTNLLYSTIGLGLWYPIFYTGFEQKSLLSGIVNNLIACAMTVSLWIGLVYIILYTMFPTDNLYLTGLRTSIPWRAGIGVMYFEIFVLVYYLIIYYQRFKEKMIREAELKALVKESELNSLKAQINPHFLFNSLNSISSLTMTQPDKAQEMIIKLSDFLRYSISNKDEHLTTLQDELVNINRYLDIEKIRFGKRLSIRQNIQDSCMKHRLPSLILQPLIENAVKYGVYESTDTSWIDLAASCHGSDLTVVIRNDYDREFQYKKGEGIGLENIRSRMRILYLRDDLVLTKKNQDVFEVKVIFPQE